MSKKIINGLLIAFCIAIYGAIIFKAFGKKKNISEPFADVVNYKSNINLKKASKDSFVLSFPERNPFGSPSYANKNTKKFTPKPSIKKETPKTKLVWPSITYYGFVKNNINNERLVALKVDNKLYKVREKESVLNIKIKKILDDSIVLLFNNEEKKIEKQN